MFSVDIYNCSYITEIINETLGIENSLLTSQNKLLNCQTGIVTGKNLILDIWNKILTSENGIHTGNNYIWDIYKAFHKLNLIQFLPDTTNHNLPQRAPKKPFRKEKMTDSSRKW